mmetsp:Transcript_19388/g.29167  ORF Transcript_19388/g.29167 Transcript_19388/m.29167 type:complete len:111 (-) Transcript_19388:193-525(-)|eukprot:CAMPEP_0178919468 /NCGR_PEP_ID=MMETSP0786-20121207/14454_1 /TAXON_ID=186022 /ORGANISM="Thalassionema frauenfeldii, Strain CCMP 1798" /LENGTH=110 /DNA_ID=CAMNT_0020593403 /DNA_START=101 /DNA_END=433 /DNA_ORIENTATION=+
MSLDGAWSARKDYCSFGYEAVWVISSWQDDELTATEQRGSKCCGFVPNCFLKTHRMKKVRDGHWEGTLGYKKVSITQVPDNPNQLRHVTTDGLMTLTRLLDDEAKKWDSK